MADLLTMRTEVQEYLGLRSDVTDTMVDRILNEVIRSNALNFRHYTLELAPTFNTVVGQTFYDLSAITASQELTKIEAVTQTTTGEELTERDSDWYIGHLLGDSGPVTDWFRRGTGIIVWPTPVAVVNHTVWAIRRPATLAADTDTPEAPVEWHRIFMLLCASTISFKLKLDEGGRNLKNEALALVASTTEEPTRQQRNRMGQLHMERPINDQRREDW